MWRSFFYAVGIGLFGLGAQSLVLDEVMIPNDSKLQRLIRKVVSDDGPRRPNLSPITEPSAGATSSQAFPSWERQANSANSANSASPRQAAQNQTSWGSNVNSGSRYGPSRFAGPAYGTGYGGGRVGTRVGGQAGGADFGPVQGRPSNAQLASYDANRNAQVRPSARPVGGLQKLAIRDWMPWSLLASGAITFLYTRTLDRRRIHD